MENKLILVDADSLCYQSSKETLQESIQIMDEKIQNMYDKTEATHAAFFISTGKYFRHDIDPFYKSGRGKYPTTLKWLKSLKMYLKEAYNANSMNLVEADDLIAYWYNTEIVDYGESLYRYSDLKAVNIDPTNFTNINSIICSPDKDLLQSISGTHFNYSYRGKDFTQHKATYTEEDIEKGWWVETSKEQAFEFACYQMIVGDAADGIKGLNGKGVKYFEKVKVGLSISKIFQEYVDLYGISKGVYEFYKNFTLLHLLESDEDFMREIGQLPEFPNIIEIKKPEIIEYESN